MGVYSSYLDLFSHWALSLLAVEGVFFLESGGEVKEGIRFFETGEMFHFILENLYLPFQVSGPSHHTTKLDLH